MAKQPVPTALFTGAGASKAIGYALTAEFLPRIRQGLRNRDLFARTSNPAHEKKCRRELARYLNRLLPGLNLLSNEQLPLVTDVFSLVDHALAGDGLPMIGNEDDLRRFQDLLRLAITDVLLEDYEYDWDDDNPEEERQHRMLNKLVRWILNTGKRTTGLVSTNYDIGIEHELYVKMREERVLRTVDLGFDWRDVDEGDVRPRPSNPAMRIYKLHGSLNLLRCALCGHVYFNPWGGIVHHAFNPRPTWENTCHCSSAERLKLHIVAPSMVRDIREPNLLSTWRSALEWLRAARRWVIVGYSLPPEDLAIRSLLLRAYAASENKPEIVVVQRSDSAKPRYQAMFGDCNYRCDGLEGFLDGEE